MNAEQVAFNFTRLQIEDEIQMMNVEQFALKLSRLETEDDVIQLLKEEFVWDNPDCWKPFGGNENNFSTIGNQQSAPDSALVEKLVNSGDAILMKECLLRGIDPETDAAPQSINEALEKFFGIKNGKISNIESKIRNRMSNNIVLAATGGLSTPNYTIVDFGEGQTPMKMPDTILSIGKANKLRVPFVQGKFNMGGTGVFQFCGKRNIQIIITRRCPGLSDNSDTTINHYGFTVIRREDPSEGRRNSMYQYLTDRNGKMLMFESKALNIVPDVKKEYSHFDHGMYIKMFNYSLPGAMKTNILFDLNYRLALLMPNLAHPIRLKECRDYRGHTFETTLSGLNVRLDDDRNEVVEKNFPSTFKFSINEQQFQGTVYAFTKEAKDKRYRSNEGIIFTVNGQTHGGLAKTFFNRKAVNLSYVADSILVVVDCSEINGRAREDLFMNSRDRLRDSELKREIEKNLEEVLKTHSGLKALQEERRRDATAEKLQDQKPLTDVLKDILKKSPILSKLFIDGSRLANPFNLSDANTTDVYKGKKYPTFFVLKNKPAEGILTKNVPINHKFRVQFETDVINDYFDRDVYPGSFKISCDGIECSSYSLNLFNGIVSLNMGVEGEAQVGAQLLYDVVLTDTCSMTEFAEKFIVNIEKPEEYGGGNGGSRRKPADKLNKGDREKPSGLALPNIYTIGKSEWEDYDIDKFDAMVIKETEENGYDFFINVDNIHLRTEEKGTKNVEKAALITARYKYGMVLVALGVINYYKQHPVDDEDFCMGDMVKNTTAMVSPILLPMIESLGGLDIEDTEYLPEDTSY